MILAKVTCETCGTVTIRSKDIHVKCCPEIGLITYTFKCDSCGKIQAWPASETILSILVGDLRLPIEYWSLPQRESIVAPPLTEDDLIDFALAIRATDFLVMAIA